MLQTLMCNAEVNSVELPPGFICETCDAAQGMCPQRPLCINLEWGSEVAADEEGEDRTETYDVIVGADVMYGHQQVCDPLILSPTQTAVGVVLSRGTASTLGCA